MGPHAIHKQRARRQRKGSDVSETTVSSFGDFGSTRAHPERGGPEGEEKVEHVELRGGAAAVLDEDEGVEEEEAQVGSDLGRESEAPLSRKLRKVVGR